MDIFSKEITNWCESTNRCKYNTHTIQLIMLIIIDMELDCNCDDYIAFDGITIDLKLDYNIRMIIRIIIYMEFDCN